jgi:hypothetical protein
VTVRLTGNTLGTTKIWLMKPNGMTQTTVTSSASSFNAATQTLTATGTYTVIVDPSLNKTGAISVRVTSP